MKPKVIVFDVDETLGYFTQFSIFGHVLEEYFNKPGIMYRYFNDLVDLYPEIIRPNMVRILDYIRKKKNAGVCSKVMIYTNNAGPDKWVGHIRQYFENKLRTFTGGGSSSSDTKSGLAIVPPLFDHTIGGFKPNQESTSSSSTYPQRTTSHKTVNEFIRCGRLPSDIEICFLDDVEHPKMVDERVYYIKLQPYHSYIPFEMFVVRFLNSALYRDVFDKFNVPSITPGMASNAKKQILSIEIHNLFVKYANLSEYDAKANQQDINPREIDEIISKYILYHLHQFFREGPPQLSLQRGLKPSSNRRRTIKTSKKKTSTRSQQHPASATSNIFYVDKTTSVKNMRNKTMRKR
jgi:hypothetical protein